MRRAAVLPLLAALLLPVAACEPSTAVPCPGTLVASFDVSGSLSAASCAAGPSAGYGSVVPTTLDFGVLVAYDAGPTTWVCTGRSLASPLTGSRTGEHLSVAVDTTGAVLAGCASGCGVTVQQRLEGDVLRDASQAVTGFTGTLTEVTVAEAGDACGECTLPCQATWALTGVPVPFRR